MNRFCKRAACAALLLFFCVVCNAQLKGLWHFDESKGTVTADVSPNKFHGSLRNITRTAGVQGNAVNLVSGSSSINFPSSLSSSGFPASGCIAFWIKGNFSALNKATIIDNWRAGDHLFIRTGSNTEELQIALQQSNGNYGFTFLMPVTSNKWTHVAVSWDAVNHAVFIYKNAALVKADGIGTNSLIGNDDPLANGWAPTAQSFSLGALTNSFIGAIDELALVDKPLSPVQIRNLYDGEDITAFDSTAPNTPTNVRASAVTPKHIRVGWDEVTDEGNAGLAGYLIYRNGIPYKVVFGDSYTNMSNIVPTYDYNYSIAAFDFNGNGSLLSNIAYATTPSKDMLLISDFEAEPTNARAEIFPWGQQGKEDSSVIITKEMVRNGERAIKFTFGKNDWKKDTTQNKDDNLRAEVLPITSVVKNLGIEKSYWIGFSEFVPANWQVDDAANPDIIWQFHGAANGPSSGSPPLSAVVIKDSLFIETRTGNTPSKNGQTRITIAAIPLPRGVWSDWVINCDFSYQNGFIKIWRNGQKVADYTGPNLYISTDQTNEDGPYLKLGIYKFFWGSQPTVAEKRIIYADEIRMARDSAGYNSVNPKGAHDSGFIDKIAPSIALHDSATIYVRKNNRYKEAGAYAFDAEDGLLPVTITGAANTANTGTYIVHYVVKDYAGNMAETTRTVIVFDDVPQERGSCEGPFL